MPPDMPTANKSAKATTQDRTAVIKEYGQQKTGQSEAASESKRQSEIAEVLTKAWQADILSACHTLLSPPDPSYPGSAINNPGGFFEKI